MHDWIAPMFGRHLLKFEITSFPHYHNFFFILTVRLGHILPFVVVFKESELFAESEAEFQLYLTESEV